jgi:hypothetical protein
MTPQEFVQRIKAAAPSLQSALLYGSAAAGDMSGSAVRHDLLLVAKQWSIAELHAMSDLVQQWQKAGNPIPQLFTTAELATSADVFPIEILDLQQSREVLLGPDPIADLHVDLDHLRLQLEHELRSKLLFLRQRCLAAGGDPQRIASVLAASLSSFLVLFRAALRLYDKQVPAQKRAALLALAQHVPFDAEPFVTLLDCKERGVPPGPNPVGLAGSYLGSIEQVVEAVDQHIRQSKGQA